MITVLGIDPGLADTGWGVLRAEGSRLLHIDHGTITTSADKSTQERLLIIYDAVAEVIERYRPEYAGVENLYFAKNISSALPVAEARGVILLACVRSGVTAHGYSPPEIKQALTGSGNADKQQVQEMVKLMLGLEDIPRPDHAADALAAGICGYHMSSFSGRMQQYLQKGGGA